MFLKEFERLCFICIHKALRGLALWSAQLPHSGHTLCTSGLSGKKPPCCSPSTHAFINHRALLSTGSFLCLEYFPFCSSQVNPIIILMQAQLFCNTSGHVDVRQKPTQYCKAAVLQLKINKNQ